MTEEKTQKKIGYDLSNARNLLGEEYKDLPDEEVQKLIDMLKSICSILVETYIKEKEAK